MFEKLSLITTLIQISLKLCAKQALIKYKKVNTESSCLKQY
jgi:hypothetical protein